MVFLWKQDYELQLVAYRAQVEPLASPLKKTKLDSASDNIIQEVCFMRFYKAMNSFSLDLFAINHCKFQLN